jgi:mersacidin/lichenicidin family type 2 lantibiotic
MKFDVIRAWKDEAYRGNLSAEELAQLPENPAGAMELSESDLEIVHGAWGNSHGEDSHGHEGNSQFNTAFLLCLSTTILAVCINKSDDCR